jgi:hypothetical protein
MHKHHINTVHQNFTWKPNAGEKPHNDFLIYQRVHSLEAPTSYFSSYNWKEAPTPYLQAAT